MYSLMSLARGGVYAAVAHVARVGIRVKALWPIRTVPKLGDCL